MPPASAGAAPGWRLGPGAGAGRGAGPRSAAGQQTLPPGSASSPGSPESTAVRPGVRPNVQLKYMYVRTPGRGGEPQASQGARAPCSS